MILINMTLLNPSALSRASLPPQTQHFTTGRHFQWPRCLMLLQFADNSEPFQAGCAAIEGRMLDCVGQFA